MHEAGVDEPHHDLFAQPANVHRAAAHKVVHALQPLGRALGIRAIRDRLAVGASDRRAADRAHFREGPRSLLAGAQLYQCLHHAGDHVAVPLYHHRVAEPQILAPDFVFVEELRTRDGDAADVDRRELGDRGQRARPPHADLDIQQLGVRFHWRELICNRPAGIARHHAKLCLLPARIDFYHRAVDVVGDREASPGSIVADRLRLLQGIHVMDQWTHRKPPGLQPRQHRILALRLVGALDQADLVGQKRERPLRGDFGILLAERAGRGVARVGEEARRGTCRLGLGGQPFVQALEVRVQHVDLAANLHACGHRDVVTLVESLGKNADGTHVSGDILAHLTIAARRSQREPAVHVGQIHAEAIDFRLDDVLEAGIRQLPLCALLPRLQLVGGAYVCQTEHRRGMAHLLEASRRLARDPLRG